MLYDGDCPLCMREVNMLRRRDADVGKIQFVDIASPDYDASANAGISFEQVVCATPGITLCQNLRSCQHRMQCSPWDPFTAGDGRDTCNIAGWASDQEH